MLTTKKLTFLRKNRQKPSQKAVNTTKTIAKTQNNHKNQPNNTVT
jgi:hypothetical protein